MNTKNKKGKKKNKEELSQTKDNLKDNDDIGDNLTNSSNGDYENNIKINRKHTKFVKKNKNKNKEEERKKEEEEVKEGKNVKFGKIDIIDVECWKEINLKLTAEENVDELIKLSEGKGDKRIKNIGCTCMII